MGTELYTSLHAVCDKDRRGASESIGAACPICWMQLGVLPSTLLLRWVGGQLAYTVTSVPAWVSFYSGLIAMCFV